MDHEEFPVQRDHLEVKETGETRDPKVTRVTTVRRELLVRLDPREVSVQSDPLDQLGHLVPQDPAVHQEEMQKTDPPVNLDQLVPQDAPVPMDKMDNLVHRDPLDPPDLPELLLTTAQVVNTPALTWNSIMAFPLSGVVLIGSKTSI